MNGAFANRPVTTLTSEARLPAVSLNPIYRILDVNCNRLREAVRVIEEYFRFIVTIEEAAVALKSLRHKIHAIEDQLGPLLLLQHRDTSSDCFAVKNRPEEMFRENAAAICAANFNRAQEAARVIEEYAKQTDTPDVADPAKEIRFSLYTIEQQYCGR